MHVHRSRLIAAFSLLACAGGLALGLGASSCAQSGAGENETFTDSGSGTDGTTETGSGSSSGGGDSAAPETGGCDADTMNDLFNCGSCGHKCGSGQTCSCGTCINFCTNGLTQCCGQCVDITKDTNNCGMCGNQCLPPSGGSVSGTPHCVNSQCTFTCPSKDADGGTILTCGSDAGAPGCYDPTSSASACGGCGKTCSGTDDCVDSKCCPAGSDKICGSTCTNTQTDPQNCGGCGTSCGVGDAGTCTAGKCVGYGVTNPTAAFLDACSLPGHTTILQSQPGWAYVANVAIPFPFTFFGSAETKVWVQTQGAVGFGPYAGFPPPDSYPDCMTFDPTTGYPAAVVFGDMNLATGTDGVCYATLSPGSAGDGGGEGGADATADTGAGTDGGGAGSQLVITWSHMSDFADPGSSYTFSLVLTQGTNAIDFQYGDMSSTSADGGISPTGAGATATVGMQQGAGSMVVSKYSCHTPFITSTPFDIRFTPH